MTTEKEQRPGAIRAADFLCRFRHASQCVHSIAAIPCHSSKSLTKPLNLHDFLRIPLVDTVRHQSLYFQCLWPLYALPDSVTRCCRNHAPNFTVTSQLGAHFSPKSSHESGFTLQLQNTPSAPRLPSASDPAADGCKQPPPPPVYRPAVQPPVWGQAPPHNRSLRSCAGSSAA